MVISESEIDEMVQRFLCWELPQDFHPDGRISFDGGPDAMGYGLHWPTGTNLFTATQAKQMFKKCLGLKCGE